MPAGAEACGSRFPLRCGIILNGSMELCYSSSVENLADTIREHIADSSAIFVFPTQIAADLWADWAVQEDGAGVSAVPMERFIAWDDFKGSSIRSQHQDKTSVPALMRSVFAASFIQENAAHPVLQNLIPKEYAADAANFADWIASFLPSLGRWHQRYQAACRAQDDSWEPDGEDKDLEVLYTRYREFLDANGLFDPAWELPPFASNGNHYYIIYPQILMDWSEYHDILTGQQDVTLVSVPDIGSAPARTPAAGTPARTVRFYVNTRIEIREAALYLRSMHDKGIPWTSMAVSVPDMESYGPYLERELFLYQIPCTMRSGRPLSATRAGSFFAQAAECVRSGFSFKSVKNLLLNLDLPWKSPELNTQLITYGKQNNCLCSFSKNGAQVDIWDMAFHEIYDKELAAHYRGIRNVLKEFVHAASFKDMYTIYFNKVRPVLFDMTRCAPQSDAIISRCMSELSMLADLEQKYSGCRVPDPYAFYTNYLARKEYLAQAGSRGVQVFSYRTAASAPFDCQVVLDASQSSISVDSLYRQLPFLTDKKRRALGITDNDPSPAFITLYTVNARHGAYFSVSEQTVTGYALPYSSLSDEAYGAGDCRTGTSYDAYKAEYESVQSGSITDAPAGMSAPDVQKRYPAIRFQPQQTGFTAWRQRQPADVVQDTVTAPPRNTLMQDSALRQAVLRSTFDESAGKYRVSQSSLSAFQTCPRLWLYRDVLKARPLDNEAELIDSFLIGKINHKILELYCSALKRQNMPLQAEKETLGDTYQSVLKECTATAIQSYRETFRADGREASRAISPLARELLAGQTDAIYATIEKCVIDFSHWFAGMHVYATEADYRCDVPGKDYYFTGTIDCLLTTDTGDLALVDYKTSDTGVPAVRYYDPSDSSKNPCGPKPDFQMPLYIWLLAHQKQQAAVTPDICAFYSITSRRPTLVLGSLHNEFAGPRSRDKAAPDNASELIAATQTYLLAQADEFIRRIKAMDFEPDPAVQTYSVCTGRDCAAYRAVCRRFFTVSGDEPDTHA